MGVTAIKSIANRSGKTIYHIYNLENPDDTGGVGNFIGIGPGENLRVNIWIPWCDNQSDVDGGNRILVDALGTNVDPAPKTFSIWQSGDYVYFSLDDRFESGQLVAGNSTINGDRSLAITDDGPLLY